MRWSLWQKASIEEEVVGYAAGELGYGGTVKGLICEAKNFG